MFASRSGRRCQATQASRRCCCRSASHSAIANNQDFERLSRQSRWLTWRPLDEVGAGSEWDLPLPMGMASGGRGLTVRGGSRASTGGRGGRGIPKKCRRCNMLKKAGCTCKRCVSK